MPFFFDKSRERELNRRGGTRIASFHVLGAINYNAETGDEE
jgi:hypothetical protein